MGKINLERKMVEIENFNELIDGSIVIAEIKRREPTVLKKKSLIDGRLLIHNSAIFILHNDPNFDGGTILKLSSENKLGFKYIWYIGAIRFNKRKNKTEMLFNQDWIESIKLHKNNRFLKD